MSHNVLVIGCGQLGSRHLQSLSGHEGPLNISLVDPASDSLKKAVEIFRASAKNDDNFTLYPVDSLGKIHQRKMDMIVVASSSFHRLAIIQEIINSGIEFGVMILEKVLFPSLHEYEVAEKLLKGRNVYVNCPRRMFKVYRELKEYLKQHISGPSEFEFSGHNWGLGCNSIHFMDLVSFLSDSFPTCVKTDGLVREIIPSKRPDYVEFQGELSVEYQNGSVLKLLSSMETRPNVFVIKNDRVRVEISESAKVMKILSDGKLLEEKSFETPFQSQLTLPLFESHLKHTDIQLCPFMDSVKIHVPFIRDLGKFYREVSGSHSEILPVT